MATGDGDDQFARLKSLLPPWFGDASTLIDSILRGFAQINAFLFDTIAFAKLQTRIKTATGGWLDLIAADFFGDGATRAAGQSDASFRALILANLLRERGTRRALSTVLTDLTGIEPVIFEPSRVQDTGAYNAPIMGYGLAGRYGSLSLPFQTFVIAQRPAGSGIPRIAGYNIPAGGYARPSRAAYASLSMVQELVTDLDILAAVDAVKPAGTIIWVRIGNSVPVLGPAPTFSLFVAGGAIRLGTARSAIRLLGWGL